MSSQPPEGCLTEEVEFGSARLTVLALYNVLCALAMIYVSRKQLIGLWKRKKQRRSKVFREKKADEKQKLQNEDEEEHNQGLAMKRLLFHKMNHTLQDQDGYVDENRSQHSHKSNQRPWETDVKKIKFKKRIGAGNFGEVWVASWMQSTVAVKTVLKRMAKNQDFVAKFMEEIELMSELNHPNIVMFLGACIEPPNICLILEYCVHGNLIDFLQSAREKEINISMHLILKMALDIARGIKYLHEKVNIIQRDIKGRNVLVDENLNCKIADFGLSRIKTDQDAGLTACGTPAWTAPEVVRMEDYTEKVDVYSFGVVLWELFMREEPYAGEGGIQIAYAAAEQGLRPEVPVYAPERYAKLMSECWSDSPDDRPNFSQILERLFQMMKDESNPFKAAEFYFGQRRFDFDEGVKELLDDYELTQGMFAEDYIGILEDRRRVQKTKSGPLKLTSKSTGIKLWNSPESESDFHFVKNAILPSNMDGILEASEDCETERIQTGEMIKQKETAGMKSVENDKEHSSVILEKKANSTPVGTTIFEESKPIRKLSLCEEFSGLDELEEKSERSN